jgi:hypothetical protein
MLKRKFQLQLRRSDLQIFQQNMIHNLWPTNDITHFKLGENGDRKAGYFRIK